VEVPVAIKNIAFNFIFVCNLGVAWGMDTLHFTYLGQEDQPQVSLGTQAFVARTIKPPLTFANAATGYTSGDHYVQDYIDSTKPKILFEFRRLNEQAVVNHLTNYIQILQANDPDISSEELLRQANFFTAVSIGKLEHSKQNIELFNNIGQKVEDYVKFFTPHAQSQPAQAQQPPIPLYNSEPDKPITPEAPKIDKFEGTQVQDLTGSHWRTRPALQPEREMASLIIEKDQAFQRSFNQQMESLGIPAQPVLVENLRNVAVSAEGEIVYCIDPIIIEGEGKIKACTVEFILKSGSRELPIPNYKGFRIKTETRTKPVAKSPPAQVPQKQESEIALPITLAADADENDSPVDSVAHQQSSEFARKHPRARLPKPHPKQANAKQKSPAEPQLASTDVKQEIKAPAAAVVNKESAALASEIISATETFAAAHDFTQSSPTACETLERNRLRDFLMQGNVWKASNIPSLEIQSKSQAEGTVKIVEPEENPVAQDGHVQVVQALRERMLNKLDSRHPTPPTHIDQQASAAAAKPKQELKELAETSVKESVKAKEPSFKENLVEAGKAVASSALKTGFGDAAEFTARTLVDRAWNAWDHSSYSTPPRVTKYNSFLPQPLIGPGQSQQMSPSCPIVWDVPAMSRFVPAACGMEGPRATTQDGQGPSPEQIRAFIAKTNAVYAELRQCFEQDPVLKNTNRLVDSFNEMALIFADFGDTKVAAALANIARSTLSNGRVFLRAAANGLANTGYELAQDLRRPDLYLARNAVGIFDAAVCLMSEIERIEQLDQAMFSCDPDRFDAEAKDYIEHRQAQAERVNAMLQELRSMPWEALVEHGFAAGSRIFADIFALNALSLGAAAFKTIAPQIDAFIDAARAEKAVAAAAGVKAPGMETIETFATAGKIAADGVEIAEEVAETIVKRPDIIQAEGGVTNAAKKVANAANTRGKEFEDFLVQKLGGRGSFRARSATASREFDGAVGNVWYEAKSGEYWDMLLSSKKKLEDFKGDMGRGLNVAKANGAIYELHSNSPIPQGIKNWLTKKGINFTEWL
jgi:hypothetical protein